MNPGKIQKRGTIAGHVLRKNVQGAALRHLYTICTFVCFCALEKWHIFLFSTAYFPSYWHMALKNHFKGQVIDKKVNFSDLGDPGSKKVNFCRTVEIFKPTAYLG